MDKLIEFITHHWFLVSLFLVLLLALIIEEVRSSSGAGGALTPQQLTDKVNRDNAFLLDVRGQDIYKKGHIARAMNIPKADLATRIKKIEKYKKRPVIVIDEQGRDATGVASQLRKAGFEDVFTLQNGLMAWRNASLPLVQPSSKKQ